MEHGCIHGDRFYPGELIGEYLINGGDAVRGEDYLLDDQGNIYLLGCIDH